MKLSLSIVLLNAASAWAKINYDGAQAMRIPVGEDVTPLMEIIQKLSLPTWKGVANGVPVANSHVDLVVPASKVAKFNEMTTAKGMKTEIMHEDLGASIAEEEAVVSFACKFLSLLSG